MLIRKTTSKVAKKFNFHEPRVKVVKKIINIVLLIITAGIILFIWGVDQSQLALFISTLLTILGIAFVAQWSILSNVTATLIIFFNHPARLGDHITIVDKEYPIEGVIIDIGMFFVIIKTNDGEKITVPSNVFILKMVKRKDLDDEK
jgi:small-conductance mechanosensitive channel